MAESRRLEHRRAPFRSAKGRFCFLLARELPDFAGIDPHQFPGYRMRFRVCGRIAGTFGKVMAEYGNRFHEERLGG
jgi:hypothetical protein